MNRPFQENQIPKASICHHRYVTKATSLSSCSDMHAPLTPKNMICGVEDLPDEIEKEASMMGTYQERTLLIPDQVASECTPFDERERRTQCAVHTWHHACAHVQYTHTTSHYSVPHCTALHSPHDIFNILRMTGRGAAF